MKVYLNIMKYVFFGHIILYTSCEYYYSLYSLANSLNMKSQIIARPNLQ